MARRSSNSGVVWQVIAPWVRWPLRSPTRLAMVLVGLTLVFIVASNVTHRVDSADAAPAATPASDAGTTTSSPGPSLTSTIPPTAAPSSASTTAGQPAAASAPAGDTPGSVAAAFVTLWARPDVTQPSWSQALQPMAAQAYGQELTTVLPVNVPARSVTGAAPAEVTGAQAYVVVTTDVGTVRVALTDAAQGWRVDSVSPEHLTPGGSVASSIAPTYTAIPRS